MPESRAQPPRSVTGGAMPRTDPRRGNNGAQPESRPTPPPPPPPPPPRGGSGQATGR